MVPEALEGLLWLARLGLRSDTCRAQAGHGYADPNFRPSTVPFVSLVGPLSVDLEPERDAPEPSDLLVRLPGYVLGATRTDESVAAGSTLTVTFDGSATTTVSCEAGDFTSDENARLVCAALQSAFRAAAPAGGFVDNDGQPITDAVQVAELARISCRWDESSRAIGLSSGRHGYLQPLASSSVQVASGTATAALGLAPPAQVVSGRHVRQKAKAPQGFALDVRIDLWTATQRDLAHLVDALTRAVPTRTSVPTRPALLAQDVVPGDTQLQLLSSGEPTRADSLLHLEGPDGFDDRVSGESLSVTSTASALADPPRLRFTGDGHARAIPIRAPTIPDPSADGDLAPSGVAVSLGLTLVGGAASDSGRIMSLTVDGHNLLSLDFGITPGASALQARLTAAAEIATAGGVAIASTTRALPLAQLQAGVAVHVALSPSRGEVSIALDGQAQDLSDSAQTPLPPVLVVGTPANGETLEVVIGNPAGNPIAFDLDHLHLFRAPLLALDPRLRASTNAAIRFRAGDTICLTETDNGCLPTGASEGFYVRSVSADTVVLDRPVAAAWRRGRALVHSRSCFLHQRKVTRRDDLMNRLYRYCVGYRVSTWLEHSEAVIRGNLVVEPAVEVEALDTRERPGRIGSAAPGVKPKDADRYLRPSEFIQE